MKGGKGGIEGSQEGSHRKEAEVGWGGGIVVDMGEPNLACHPVWTVLSKAQGR